jgi:transposase InsO family protein
LAHANAVLTPVGRRLLVDRVLSGRPQSHVAKELGVSRQCVARWVSRFRAEGVAGLHDRSSRPRTSPSRTPASVRDRLLGLRVHERLGPPELARRCGVSASTASRLIARAGLPKLFELDPVTGIQIRASRRTQLRYERSEPGDLIHIDVKKLGRIPDGGGWRGRGELRSNHAAGHDQSGRIGFDYVHAAVDDHSRLAYAEVLADESGPTCAGFLTRAAQFYAGHGINIRQVMSDNAWNYRLSTDFQSVIQTLGAKHILIKPHCPWQNGKVERFNRTMQEGWAYRQVFTANTDRADALSPWLDHYNYDRPHTACGGKPPISRVPPTC